MKKLSFALAFVIIILNGYANPGGPYSHWSLVLHQPGQSAVEIVQLPADRSKPFSFAKDENGIHISFSLEPGDKYTVFKAVATKENGQANVYFSLRNTYTSQLPFNFDGEVTGPEIYRQSRHDVNARGVKGIAEQAVPVIALKSAAGFEVALNGSPALYNNFTSQAFYTDQKVLELSSGDNGESPGLKPYTTQFLHNTDYNANKTQRFALGKVLPFYPAVAPSKPHVFEGIIFTSRAHSQQQSFKDQIKFYTVFLRHVQRSF